MEIWDGYLKDGSLANVDLVRGEPIPNGLYHMVCDIIVRHTDGTYLLMQRDRHKHFGEMWEASAGGSALKGESPLECAIRELKEETGIISNDLQELGRSINHSRQTIYVEYFCLTDQDKSAVILQKGETQDYKWVDRETLVDMRKGGLVTNRMHIFLDELQRG